MDARVFLIMPLAFLCEFVDSSLGMGVVILTTMNRKPRFSWGRISILGNIASFNKGMSGGG